LSSFGKRDDSSHAARALAVFVALRFAARFFDRVLLPDLECRPEYQPILVRVALLNPRPGVDAVENAAVEVGWIIQLTFGMGRTNCLEILNLRRKCAICRHSNPFRPRANAAHNVMIGNLAGRPSGRRLSLSGSRALHELGPESLELFGVVISAVERVDESRRCSAWSLGII
jgi:hypothetical protein